MDAFFASVEVHDDPSLRGKPIAVGFDGPRGVVSTASYEARRFGVHSAMSIAAARRRCPQLIVVDSHYARYKEVSAKIHEIFHDYTDLIEPISLDEAFLDVTDNKRGIALAVDIAREIKQRIHDATGLTASAGVSYCKLLAKIASDYRKPDGLTVIHPDRAIAFLDKLRVETIWGVGRKTAERMHAMGISTVPQLRARSRAELVRAFGKAGAMYFDFARGIDERPVEPFSIRKSVGCEETFLHDLFTREEAEHALAELLPELVRRLRKAQFRGRTLTLKVKWSDFTQITRSFTLPPQPAQAPTGADEEGEDPHRPTLRADEDTLRPLALRLLHELDFENPRPIRLLGLAVSNPLLPAAPADGPRYIQLYIKWPED